MDLSKYSSEELQAIVAKAQAKNKEPSSKNGEYQFGKPEEVSKGKANLKNVGAGLSDAIANMGKASASTLFGSEYNPSKSGEGGYYETAKFAGEMIPFIVSPASALGRVAVGTGAGALFSPEDVSGGAQTGALVSGIAESIPYVGKGVRAGADKFFRKDYTEGLMEMMTDHYNFAKYKALTPLTELMDKFGDKKMGKEQVAKIEEIYKGNKAYLDQSYSVKDMHKIFEANPNMKNAQDLQSMMGASLRGLDETQIENRNFVEAFTKSRGDILNVMGDQFDSFSPNAGKKYHEEFRKPYGKNVAPYENNPKLNKIVHGERAGVTPKTLSNMLSKSVEGIRSGVVEDHPLRSFDKALSEKLQRSEMYSKMGQIGTAGLAGVSGASAFGPSGAALAALGPMASHVGGAAGQLALNDQLAKALASGYPYLRQPIVSQAVSPSEGK